MLCARVRLCTTYSPFVHGQAIVIRTMAVMKTFRNKKGILIYYFSGIVETYHLRAQRRGEHWSMVVLITYIVLLFL